MEKITFFHNDGEGFEAKLSFEEKEIRSIWTYHDYCKRFAIAMGYHPNSVERAFGETNYDEILDI